MNTGLQRCVGQVLVLFALVVACQPALSAEESGGWVAAAVETMPVPEPAEGAGPTLYVAPDGADGQDGSAGAPLETIQEAVERAEPGDTILLQSGTYAGARIERSGTPEAWITLKAAPGAQVLINAPGPENRHDSNLEFETWEGDGIVAYWVVEGLEVAGAPNWGIDVRGSAAGHAHHFVLRDNVVHDNGLQSRKTGIFTAFVDDVVLEGNESYGNGEHGIYLSNSGDRFMVRGNHLHHNVYCGLHLNADASQGGDGIISQGRIEANVIYENGENGCSAINMDGVTETTVANNLLYQNHAGGISLFRQDGAVCSRDNRVLNNTIVMAEDGRWGVNLSHADCTNNKLFNNIIYSYHAWRGSISLPAEAEEVEGFESDYNVLMDRLSVDDGNSVLTLAEWQARGYDAHSFIAAPPALFVGTGDFHLRPGSPAIDAGLELPDVTTDLEGRSRPQGVGYDIGALEYVDVGAESVVLPLVVKGVRR